jgi:HSP20 family molecular chaperone IbpA
MGFVVVPEALEPLQTMPILFLDQKAIRRTAKNGVPQGPHFQRTFVLAEGMLVLGADLKNGLLSVDLARPEPEKVVKTITINEHE